MRTKLPFFVFLLMLFFVSSDALAQASACPQVNAGPDQTICGGCTTLNATVQGTVGTTTYTSAAIPYNPYPFTGGNPVLVNQDDIWSGVVNLPFCFEFFGNTYNQYVIGANALITFDLTQAGQYCQWPINAANPTNQNPMNSIMAPFHDIDPSVGTPTSATDINWQVYGTAPCREMVVNWNDVAMFSCNSIIATSQLVLHESTNIIDIYIQDKPLCTAWNGGAAIEGIQNATGTVAFTAPGRNFPTQWTATNDGYRFMPAGASNYTVQWVDQNNNVVGTGTSVTVCPTQTTTYTAILTNPTCSTTVVVTDQVTVNVTPGNMTVVPSSVQPGCSLCNGSASVVASGGTPPYTYSWAPTGGTGATENNLCPGTYTCTITESGGCQTTATFNLTGPPSFTTTMSSTTATCGGNNGSATATVNGGTGPFTYTWSPSGGNAATASNLAPGTYTVTILDAGGCSQTSTITVANSGMNVAQSQTTPSCNGGCNGTATATASNGTPPYTYVWAPSGGNAATANGLCAGVYTCTVSDGGGCTTTLTFTITQPAPITLTMSNNVSVCAGSSTVITATPSGGTGPYTVSWDNGLPNGQSNSVSPVTNTTYNATVTDANGCTTTQPVSVSVNPVPTAAFTSSLGDCAPSDISFTDGSSSANTYSWDFDDPASGVNNTSTSSSPIHNFGAGGIYNVTLIVTSANGCTDTITNPVTVFGYPTAGVTVADATVSQFDPTAVFTDASSGGVNCVTYFGDGDSIVGCNLGAFAHTYPGLGTYTIMQVVINANGCADTTYITVEVQEETTLYVPNAFTPNNTGENNTFFAYGANVEEFQLYVFDRWGMLLFESKDISKGWDGTFHNQACQEDVYVWRIIYTDNQNKRHRLIGHVTLLR